MLEKPKEKREIQEHILKLVEIDKMPGEQEKVDRSGSLLVKLGELAGLQI